MSAEAWHVIVATFRPSILVRGEAVAAEDVASATSPCTENLLRCILPLTPAQQVELCTKRVDQDLTTQQCSDLARDSYARNDTLLWGEATSMVSS